MTIEIDKNAGYIEVYADWYTQGKPGQCPPFKAIAEIKSGKAVALSPTSIKLLFKEKPLRQRVMERDKHICAYCGDYGDTLDHIFPKSAGGYNRDENCVCACKRCNRMKKAMPLHEFIKEIISLKIDEQLNVKELRRNTPQSIKE